MDKENITINDTSNISNDTSNLGKGTSHPGKEQDATEPQSYAVRPHHRQRRLIEYNGRDKMFKVRNTLNIVFMLLAVIGLILWTQTDYTNLSIGLLLVGVALKIVEVCLRLFKKG